MYLLWMCRFWSCIEIMGISWWLKYPYIQMDEKKELLGKGLVDRGSQIPSEKISPLLISKALWCLLDMNLNKFQEIVKDRGGLQSMGSQRVWHDLGTEYNNGVCINYCLWTTYWSISSTEYLSVFILMIIWKILVFLFEKVTSYNGWEKCF